MNNHGGLAARLEDERANTAVDGRRFFGKVDRASGATYELAWHLEDASAVASKLASQHPLVERLASAWDISHNEARDLLKFLAELHDLGKFSDRQGYQQKCRAWLAGERPHERMHHTDAGQALLVSDQVRLSELLGIEDAFEVLRFLSTATGHHGRASSHLRQPGMTANSLFSDLAKETAWSRIEAAARRNPGAVQVLRAVAEGKLNAARLSWPVAGFVVLADWLASNLSYFPLSSERDPLRQAEAALAGARVLPRAVADATSESIAGHATLRPLQRAVLKVPVSSTPGTYILEAETGSGKTEAALLLTHRLLQHGATGVYWALPTKATSDSLHTRLVPAAKRLLRDVIAEDVILAHGNLIREDGPTGDEPDCASRRAKAWLADNLKKALLAPFAVGTIDQALLAALPVKFQSLRLLGLVGKVLVVDEVHAYDGHELRLLEHLLKQHRVMGGHAILLSATLPSPLRNRLLGQDVRTTAYPVVSWNNDRVDCLAVPDHLSKAKRIKLLHSPEAALGVLADAAAPGKVVGWIRNTVKEASEAYDLLRARGVGALLFHSRFVQADRRRIQEAVNAAEADERPGGGLVVVATQVLEQSLDVDFDVLVTDLCPADLIVQRMGRLHRHARDAAGKKRPDGPDARGEAVLFVHAPHGQPRADLFTSWSPGTAAVYRNDARLWRTLERINQTSEFVKLEDLRDFVEAVYDPDGSTPECFDQSEQKDTGDRIARRQVADWKALPFEDGYWVMTEVGDHGETATRLGEPSTWVVLTRNGKPLYGDWRESRLQIRNGLLRGLHPGPTPDAGTALGRQVEQGFAQVYDADDVGYTSTRGWV